MSTLNPHITKGKIIRLVDIRAVSITMPGWAGRWRRALVIIILILIAIGIWDQIWSY